MPRTERRSPHLLSGTSYGVALVALAAALAVTVAVAIAVGTVHVPVGEVVEVIAANLTGRGAELDPLTQQIVWEFRTPRVLLAALAGAGLSLAGVCLQALVRNPLADPYVFGVSAGASLGAVLAMTTGAGAAAALGVTGAAFTGSLVSLLVVFALAQHSGRLLGSSLVLAGVAVAYLGNALTGYLQLQADPAQLRGVMFWLLGSVAGASWSDLAIPAVAATLCTAVLLTRAGPMNALSAGDDTAAGLGVEVQRLRIVLLVASSLLTASIVSVAGGIGFVGLIVPHAVRLLVGPDHRKVVPVSLLGGAVFLVVVDLLARTVDRPNEIPIGIVTAALGAPFFLMLLRNRKGVLR